jgi:putative membrane protein
MPVKTWAPLFGGALLASAWTGPLPAFARESFTAHMGLHLLVVAVAAPLLALAVLHRRGPQSRALRLLSPWPASLLELVVVWAWHLPQLHHAARSQLAPFIAEQGLFLAAGLLFWLSIVGAAVGDRGRSAGTAVVALAGTLAHMTLLGALLALAPRPLYAHAGSAVDALADQQRGGALMLVVSTVIYLGAALLTARPLVDPALPGRAGTA